MGMMNRKDFSGWKPGQKIKPVLVTGPGLTKQEFVGETDINAIMKRYNATGVLPVDMAGVQPVFADVSNIGDFASVMQKMTSAQEAFNSLDPHLRARFGNSPADLVEFIQDDRNRDEAVRLGLVPALAPKKEPEVIPPPAPVVK